MKNQFLQFFSYQHLPNDLKEISKPFGELAERIEILLPENPEKATALRKLLEAKDCAVRAKLYKEGVRHGEENKVREGADAAPAQVHSSGGVPENASEGQAVLAREVPIPSEPQGSEALAGSPAQGQNPGSVSSEPQL